MSTGCLRQSASASPKSQVCKYTMNNLEKELHRLSKIEPSAKFCREAKNRLYVTGAGHKLGPVQAS